MSVDDTDPEIDWNLTTWEGSRRAQLRRALAMTVRERLEAMEGLADVARRFQEMREQGLFRERGRKMTTTSAENFFYGDKPAQVRPAAGTKGVLIRTLDGTIMFRVYEAGGVFTDYEIRHDDLAVTIDPDALAAFYKVEGWHVLDHGPEVLGLEKISGGADEKP